MDEVDGIVDGISPAELTRRWLRESTGPQRVIVDLVLRLNCRDLAELFLQRFGWSPAILTHLAVAEEESAQEFLRKMGHGLGRRRAHRKNTAEENGEGE